MISVFMCYIVWAHKERWRLLVMWLIGVLVLDLDIWSRFSCSTHPQVKLSAFHKPRCSFAFLWGIVRLWKNRVTLLKRRLSHQVGDTFTSIHFNVCQLRIRVNGLLSAVEGQVLFSDNELVYLKIEAVIMVCWYWLFVLEILGYYLKS